MAQNIYLSYCEADRSAAGTVREALSKNGIAVSAADTVTSDVNTAVQSCGAFVLILSRKAQKDSEVRSQLEVACREKKPTIVIAVEDCAVSKAFNFLLPEHTRIELFRKQANTLNLLVNLCREALGMEAIPLPKAPEKKSHKKLIIVIITAIILCLAAVGIILTVTATKSGTDGELTWRYNTWSHALELSGEGEIGDDTADAPSPWNAYKSEIQTLSIGEGITAIGESAFENCTSIQQVTLPPTLHTIKSRAFYGCSSIMTIDLSPIVSIGDEAFFGCGALASVSLSERLNSIGEKALCDCTKLTKLEVPSAVAGIGDYALGWHYSDDGVLYRNKLFSLTVTKGSAADTYAVENEITHTYR